MINLILIVVGEQGQRGTIYKNSSFLGLKRHGKMTFYHHFQRETEERDEYHQIFFFYKEGICLSLCLSLAFYIFLSIIYYAFSFFFLAFNKKQNKKNKGPKTKGTWPVKEGTQFSHALSDSLYDSYLYDKITVTVLRLHHFIFVSQQY